MSQDGQRSIVYQPALDGLRAVAVILVLLFHLGFGWMTGGYLGVSVFFTLSGFLITTLLVTELQRTGDLRITRFYGRRARRLLPASLICLAGACLLIAAELVPDRSGLRWYVFGGLFQFANWVPLGLQNSYAELFRALSPTDHFWSLAIEEQFYWLWPVTMLGLFRLVTRGHRSARRGRNADRADLVDANRPRPTDQIDQADDWLGRLLRALAVLFVVFAVSAPITAQLWSPDAAYFATWARVPEILAGAVLAVLVVRFELPAVTRLLAPIGLVAILALGVLTPATNGFAYEGALPLFALVSAGLIAGLQHRSMVTALLAQAPLVYLGRISYGVYLYHWPVFVVLTEARTGLGVVALSGLRLAVTFAVAVLSFHIVEQPVRERRILPRPRLGLAATGLAIPLVVLLGLTQVSNSSSFEQTSATLAPVAGTIAPLVNSSGAPSTSTPVTTSAKPPVTDPGSQTSEPDGNGPPGSAAPSEPVGSTTTAPVPASTTTVVSDLVPSRPVRMLIIGDSTALATSVGLAAWAEAEPQLAAVEVQGFGGCGVTNQGEQLFGGEWLPESAGCTELFDSKIPERVRVARPDVVVVISSFWEVTDHRFGGDPTPRSVLDPVYRAIMSARYSAYNRMLLAAGAPRVAWVLYPATDYGWDDTDEPADDPARYVAFYAIQRLVAEQFPDEVVTIDFATWSDAMGLTTDHAARPDGVHWTPDVSTDIAERWLGNEIVQAALQ